MEDQNPQATNPEIAGQIDALLLRPDVLAAYTNPAHPLHRQTVEHIHTLREQAYPGKAPSD